MQKMERYASNTCRCIWQGPSKQTLDGLSCTAIYGGATFKPGVKPKTVLLKRDKIYVTYEIHIPDRDPVAWVGVDMNAKNDTYACTDGTVFVVRNNFTQEYNGVHSKILRGVCTIKLLDAILS